MMGLLTGTLYQRIRRSVEAMARSAAVICATTSWESAVSALSGHSRPGQFAERGGASHGPG